MSVSPELTFNESTDRITGFASCQKSPANLLLIIMIKGIFTKWKQVIGYVLLKHGEELQPVKDIIFEALKECNDAGVSIFGLVCDMDTSQQKLARDLGVSVVTPYFINPSSGDRVYFFFDPPHLLKCARNNLVNYDIQFESDSRASWNVIEAFWKLEQGSAIKFAPKLTCAHIRLPIGKKMSVRLAAEVFSWSVHAGILAYADHSAFVGVTDKQVRDTAQFVKLLNRLWDIINSASLAEGSVKGAITKGLLPFYVSELKQFRERISKWTFINQRPNPRCAIRNTLPFKEGFMITLSAFEQSLPHLFISTEANFLCMRRFNQDCNENVNCLIRRDKGSFYENVGTTRAVYNLRSVALNMFLTPTSKNSNCAVDDYLPLLDCYEQPLATMPSTSSSSLSTQTPVTIPQNLSSTIVDSTAISFLSNIDADLDKIQYIAGYLLRSCRSSFSSCNQCSSALVSTSSSQRPFMRRKTYTYALEGLITPSEQFICVLSNWEQLFVKVFTICINNDNILFQLSNLLLCDFPLSFLSDCHKVKCENLLVKRYLRMRLHHACRLITRQIRQQSRQSSLRKLSKLSSAVSLKKKAIKQTMSTKGFSSVQQRPCLSRFSKTLSIKKLWESSSDDQ